MNDVGPNINSREKDKKDRGAESLGLCHAEAENERQPRRL